MAIRAAYKRQRIVDVTTGRWRERGTRNVLHVRSIDDGRAEVGEIRLNGTVWFVARGVGEPAWMLSSRKERDGYTGS